MESNKSLPSETEPDVDRALVDALTDYDERLRRGESSHADAGSRPAADGVAALVDTDAAGAQACLAFLERAFPRGGHAAGLPPAEKIGRFELVRILGQGGFGVVYLARDPRLGRLVALKVPRLHTLGSTRLQEWFLREAQAAAALDHPNIVPILETGEAGPVCYIASAYCEGGDLEQWLKTNAPVAPRLAARIVETLAEATHYSHAQGILHRDLKPSNVVLAPQMVKRGTAGDELPFVLRITDFGLARFIEDALGETGNPVVGTPRYMAPEQAAGHSDEIGPATDVYALGVILYELLTGETPFQPESMPQAGLDATRSIIGASDQLLPSNRVSTHEIGRHSTVPQCRGADLRHFAPTPGGDLDWIVMKALANDPKRRYTSAGAFAADLRRYLDDEPVEARPASVTYRLRKFAHRQRRALGTIVVVSALMMSLVAAAIVVVVRDRDGREIARVRVPERGSVTITDETKTAIPSTSRESRPEPVPLSGLVPLPQSYPGIGRWQLITKGPRSFVGHNWKLTWSPDSRFVAFGDGNDVRVYSVPDFRLVHVLAGHTNSVICADWSPDGKQIASSSSDNTIRLWDAATGVPGPVLVGHRDRIDAVAWHPDSQRLASGSRDNDVRLWTNAGKPGPVLRGHLDYVYSVAWNPDGTRLASAGEGHGVRIWNADGKLENVIDAGRLRTIAWSPDGKQLLGIEFWPGIVRTWNPDGTAGLTIEAHPGDEATSAAWSPDGKWIVSGAWDDTARLWSADGTPGPVLAGHDGNVFSVKWSPDGKWIATGAGDRSVRLWSADGQPGPVLNGSPDASAASWRPDGQSFAIGAGDHTIRILSADGDERTLLEGHPHSVHRVEWSPDGRQIVSGSSDGTIRVWNVDARKTTAVIAAHENVIRGLAWSPSGRWIAAGGVRDETIRLWNADGTAGPRLDGHRHKLYEMEWNPLDGRLASVSQDGTLRVWNAEFQLQETFIVGELLASVAWKPDGTQLASGCENGTIQLWRSDGQPGKLLKGHTDRVTSIAWSSDGKWIASGGRDNTVRVWSDDGEPLTVFRGHDGTTSSVRWRPHSAQIVSAGSDGTVRLWDAESRQPKWILVLLRDKQSIKMSPEGSKLAGDANVFEREFAYILEKPNGAMEIVSPSEFERRKSGE